MAEFETKPRSIITLALRSYRGPTLAELREQAEDALAEPEGIDFGPLSRAERDRLMAKKFGI